VIFVIIGSFKTPKHNYKSQVTSKGTTFSLTWHKKEESHTYGPPTGTHDCAHPRAPRAASETKTSFSPLLGVILKLLTPSLNYGNGGDGCMT